MKNTVFPHKFWRPFLDCMPRLFFRPQYVWFPVHLKGLLIPLWYETLVVNWQNWLFTLFHQSRSVLSPNPVLSWLSTEYDWMHEPLYMKHVCTWHGHYTWTGGINNIFPLAQMSCSSSVLCGVCYGHKRICSYWNCHWLYGARDMLDTLPCFTADLKGLHGYIRCNILIYHWAGFPQGWSNVLSLIDFQWTSTNPMSFQ